VPGEVPRVYADTSVFGGAFDDEFEAPSRAFFEQVRAGQIDLVTSGLVRAEIGPAPDEVRALFTDMLAFSEIIEPSVNGQTLRQAYMDAGIVTRRSSDDALHVALATVSRCSIIVSWNFRHIVHFRKIPLYNAVNARSGYPSLTILSPREVIEYEDEDV
jgi:predicted nucleic acid-binding protein